MPDLNSRNAGKYLVLEVVTTANLTSAAHAINRSNKKAGKPVFNSTTGAIVVATGATPTSVWNTAAGAAAHTPA